MFADQTLFFAAFIFYFLATVFYIAHLIFHNFNKFSNSWLLALGRLGAVVGLLANLLALISRTMTSGNLPIASMYEFGMMFVFATVLFWFFIEWRERIPALGAFILALAFLLAGAFLSFYQEARPLIPALKSNWLLAHVLTAIIAYGALALSFGVALLYFWHKRFVFCADKELRLAKIASLADKTITFAMPFLTLLIVTGAVWAEYAWGSYWRWDPKETWSAITWIIYSIYLHGRLTKNWTASKAMALAIIGFLAVLFTFIGVNVLLPGLHSYV